MGEFEAEVLTAKRVQADVANVSRIERSHDAVFNEPVPVEIDGREFVVRELPFRRVRVYIQQFLEVASEASRQNLQAILEKDPDAQAALIAEIDPGHIITKYTDLALGVIQDATGVAVEALEDLPGSTAVELARHVLAAHRQVLERFFALRREAAHATAQKDERKNGHSSKPESSPPSSTPGSTTAP